MAYKVYTIKLNVHKDAARIAWLDSQKNRTDAIRALVDGATTTEREQTAAVDLCAIRAVFEAVIDEKLAGLSLAGQPENTTTGENPELAARLDGLEF